jgi:hypothetical protein
LSIVFQNIFLGENNLLGQLPKYLYNLWLNIFNCYWFLILSILFLDGIGKMLNKS